MGAKGRYARRWGRVRVLGVRAGGGVRRCCHSRRARRGDDPLPPQAVTSPRAAAANIARNMIFIGTPPGALRKSRGTTTPTSVDDTTPRKHAVALEGNGSATDSAVRSRPRRACRSRRPVPAALGRRRYPRSPGTVRALRLGRLDRLAESPRRSGTDHHRWGGVQPTGIQERGHDSGPALPAWMRCLDCS